MTLGRQAKELLGIAICLIVAVYYLYEALRLSPWALAMHGGGIPGAGFLPRLLGAVGIFLTLILLLRTLREQPPLEERRGTAGEVNLANPLRVLASLCGYLLVFEFLGFLLASVFMLWYLSWSFEVGVSAKNRAVGATLLSVAVTAAFWVVFVRILGLQLPVLPFGS